MIRNIINRFGTVLYVQIWEKRIKVVDINSSAVFDEKPYLEIKEKSNGKFDALSIGNKAIKNSVNPFSHPRTLFSNFHAGERLLQEIIKQLVPRNIFSPAPAIIIHPMEKTEGGLTMIEIRAFKEMGYGAGGRAVVVYQGKTLQPQTIDFSELAKNHHQQ